RAGRTGDTRLRAERGPSAAAARSLVGLLREKWALFALSAAAAAVTWTVQSHTGSVLHSISLPQRLGNAALSYWRYIGKLFRPDRLAPYYPLEPIRWASVSLALAGIVLVSLAVLRLRRSAPYLLTGWLWYLGTLVPVIGIVQVGRQAYADRYTYIPCVGLLVALVWGVADLARARRAARIAVTAAGLLAVTGLGLVTARQVSFWRDSLTLFRHTLAVTHGDAFSHQSLAVALADAHHEQEAIAEYRRAIAADSTRADTHYELASILARERRFSEARREFESAERLAGGDPELALREGEVAVDQGDRAAAEAYFRRALALKPGYVEALDRLGVLLALRGRPSEAVTELRLASEWTPRDPQVHMHLALALLRLGGHDAEAASHLRAALRLEPGSVEPCNELAWLLVTSSDPGVRDVNEGLRLSERALRLPGGADANVLDTRAAALAAAERFGEAGIVAVRAAAVARGAGQDSLARSIEAHAALFGRGLAVGGTRAMPKGAAGGRGTR
ncbi:MAG TPA: tetratricopeptide repeat protein, partial [Terriglobales bacterium]|nr:tetratricopeptide repeat protein [Terriglobales bacterium]